MGTRNLTVLVHGGEVRIAQYGQWDGYPDGQGVTALNFLHEVDLEKFKTRLETVKFMDEAAEQKLENFLKSLGSDDGWMTAEQAESYYKEYPYLHRNSGAGILKMVYESEDPEILLRNNIADFEDGLMIEWAYVIDLDAKVFEVYDGFHQAPLDDEHRFFDVITEERLRQEDAAKQWDIENKELLNKGIEPETKRPYVQKEYYNLEKITHWSLDDLPTKEVFLEYFERRQEF